MTIHEQEAEEALGKWSSSKYAVSNPHYFSDKMLQGDYDKLNDFFMATLGNKTNIVDATEIWGEKLVKPSGYEEVRIDSKLNWKMFTLGFGITVPDLSQYFESGELNPMIQIGTEQGHARGHLNNSWAFEATDSTTNIAYTPSWMTHTGGIGNSLQVQDILPDDYIGTKYNYEIILKKNLIEFQRGGETISLVIPCVPPDSSVVVTNTGAYAVALGPKFNPVSTSFRIWMKGPKDTEITFDLDAMGDVFLVESLIRPRYWPLYDWEADTLMTSGTYDSGTSHKSHPIPTYGFDGKTLLFRADTDSVTDGLRIETYTYAGNWRLYDSVTTSANTLESYTITGNFPLMRIGYEPSADGASITDAEVQLSNVQR